jgi:hypothetical protein
MTKHNWRLIEGLVYAEPYDPKNSRKKDYITLNLPTRKTEKGRYINDAFNWWLAYDFLDLEDSGYIEFKFDTAKFYIPNRALNVLRFIKNIQTKLPASHFKGKTWYDSLTDMERFGYVPLMREVA